MELDDGKRHRQKYTKAGVRTMQWINNFKASGLLFSPVAIKGLNGSAVSGSLTCSDFLSLRLCFTFTGLI